MLWQYAPVAKMNIRIQMKESSQMKARVKPLNDMINDEVRRQVKNARSDIYDEVSADVVRQTIACCLLYLDKTYEFREKRLRKVVSGILGFLELKPFGKSINSVTAMEYLKEKYGIDLDELSVIAEETKQ